MRNFINLVTEASEFDIWFAGSKVVDRSGKPLVVYHGASQHFERFDGSKTHFVEDGGAFFFTDHYGTAQAYADEHETGVVMSVYLSFKNPLIIEASDGSAIETWDWSAREIRSSALAGGHDSVIIRDNGSETLFVAFDPSQIRHVSNIA